MKLTLKQRRHESLCDFASGGFLLPCVSIGLELIISQLRIALPCELALENTSLSSSPSANFPIKVVIPYSNNSSPTLLACRVASRGSLGSVTLSLASGE